MKSASPELVALLNSGVFVRADLWTITLNGGGVVRWTSHDQDLYANGHWYMSGPNIQRGSIGEKRGVEVAELSVTIDAIDSDTINGVPVIRFISQHGLDGASVKLERAYAPDWASAITGTVIRFAGKVTSVDPIIGGSAELTVSSWLVLLNTNMPRNHFQVGCMRTLYDAGCGVNPASFSASGTVSAAGTGSFGSGLTGVEGYYSQGRVLFTSGANNGVSRTVKFNATDGRFTLVRPLPAPAAIGDTFTAFAGCDLAQATCKNKFNNLTRFKGTPYVPVPTTALGAPANASSGGKGAFGK